MKNLSVYLFWILFLAGPSFVAYRLWQNHGKLSVDAAYQKYAKEMSPKLPRMDGKNMRWDSVRYENKTLKMRFTVMNAPNNFTDDERAGFSSGMLAELKPTVCSKEETKALLDEGGAIQMTYFAPDKKRVSDDLLFNTRVCNTR